MTDSDVLSRFDLDDPKLPDEVAENAMASGDYPYEDKLKRKDYEAQLEDLQVELVKVQTHLRETDGRVVIVFEGRDAAGKGGAIKAYKENLNPRVTRVVALPKPNDRERGSWYFQRYAHQLPSAKETALFDRSWYNRGVVEPVMGFCTPAQTNSFLNEVPRFEQMLVEDGVHLFKFWLDIGQEMQLKRFHDRRHDPLKIWKLSPIDLRALSHWDDYTEARNEMLQRTDTDHAPWTIIRANDKRRARLNLIRHVLKTLDYKGRDKDKVGKPDPKIVLNSRQYLALKS